VTDAPDQQTDLDHWFATEILPHEHVLTGHLTRVWKNRAEVPDLRHDIYIRVYESAARAIPASPKSFLFATAKNYLTDKRRRERIVSIDYTPDFDALNVLSDELTPERRLTARQELRHLSDALDRLTDKCRTVIWLRRVEGLSQREVAQRLGIAETAVESQVARGMRTLQRRWAERQISGDLDSSLDTDHEKTHG